MRFHLDVVPVHTRELLRAAALALGLPLVITIALAPSSSRAETRESVAPSTAPIINGRLAGPTELFGTVAILDAATGRFFCSGTLVSPGVVVTAAHCLFTQEGLSVPAGDLLVAFGTFDVTEPPSLANRVGVARAEPHPDYAVNPTGDELPSGLDPSEHDIGMLVLARDVVEQGPVLMATEGEARGALEVGDLVTLTGFGVTDTELDPGGLLMVVQATVFDTIDREFLAGAATDAQGDSCFGDSGGPAYGFVSGRPVLLGVTSRGRMDTDTLCGAGGIWTSADEYRRWVMHASADVRVAPDLADGGRCSAASVGRPRPPGSTLAWLVTSVFVALLAHTRARVRERRAADAHDAQT